MDVYNRGYNAGIIMLGDQLGNASVGANSSILRDSNGQVLDQPTSFFAQAYTLSGGGGTVISYRGTDSNLGLEIPVLSGDLATGYASQIGLPYGAQTNLAIDFYKAVAGSNLTPEQLRAANITLTGHSLGGGLAGFVGAIFGKSATLFDNMPFESSAAKPRGQCRGRVMDGYVA